MAGCCTEMACGATVAAVASTETVGVNLIDVQPEVVTTVQNFSTGSGRDFKVDRLQPSQPVIEIGRRSQYHMKGAQHS